MKVSGSLLQKGFLMDNTAVKEEKAPAANPLGTQKIGRLMVKFAIPSVVSLLINTIYNMVDQIFIGQGVGYLGNAATNVIMPLMTLVVAVGLLLGDGAASYMSLSLGQGRPDKAAEGVGTALTLIICMGIILSIVFSIFIEPICWFFGATETNIDYCLDYGRIIAAFAICSIVDSGFASLFRADGRPKVSMIGLIIGTVTNFIFDPIFIFVCGWGVKGAAIATVMGQGFNFIYYIICAFRFKTVKITKSCLIPRFRAIKRILTLGVSSFITQAAIVIVLIVTNNLLVKYGEMSIYGPDIPLAVYGIVLKVSMLLSAPLQGIATGCQPIWGYNYGSAQYDRVKKTFWRAMIIGFGISVIAFVIFMVFPKQIINIFGAESDLYVEFAVMCFRRVLFCCYMMPFSIMIGIFFQAIGKPGRAVFISLSRQVIFFIPSVILLAVFGGVTALLWSAAIADFLAGAVAIVITIFSWKKVFKKDSLSKKIPADNA